MSSLSRKNNGGLPIISERNISQNNAKARYKI
ncbi:hypothetical protein EcWSU1_01191 [Enterobacter ludwigii]|uniref:Uncharacterized protein n=1 Tax=Enterobacter ludwigii TaxID=299767 RepID=G8LE54_9ENTR|nr:hypothetical protein EcWSU1_01191 [Enterobacter ludwigii]